jgi:pyridoxine kinase
LARILALSSQVVRGSVGLSAIVPALRHLGHDVWPMPTIVLSNHPGHPHAAGVQTPPDRMAAMADALERNGWLGEIDAIMTGYMPTAAHVQAAAAIVTRVRQTQPVYYLCDPVLGDDPKGLYIAKDAAAAIRDQLLPLADLITPNRFELSWLSGVEVQTADDAMRAARVLQARQTVATSIVAAGNTLANVWVTRSTVDSATVPRRSQVPNGTGDLLSAWLLACHLNGADHRTALREATSGVAAAIDASQGRDELNLTGLTLSPAAIRTR